MFYTVFVANYFISIYSDTLVEPMEIYLIINYSNKICIIIGPRHSGLINKKCLKF